MEKHSLVSRLGIPWRDLRILDPRIPSPSPAAIFIREQAIVFNVESLRMIITKDEVRTPGQLHAPYALQPSTGCSHIYGMAGQAATASCFAYWRGNSANLTTSSTSCLGCATVTLRSLSGITAGYMGMCTVGR